MARRVYASDEERIAAAQARVDHTRAEIVAAGRRSRERLRALRIAAAARAATPPPSALPLGLRYRKET